MLILETTTDVLNLLESAFHIQGVSEFIDEYDSSSFGGYLITSSNYIPLYSVQGHRKDDTWFLDLNGLSITIPTIISNDDVLDVLFSKVLDDEKARQIQL